MAMLVKWTREAPVKIGDRRLNKGDTIELPDDQAELLLGVDGIEPATADKPKRNQAASSADVEE
jgi:hypothetical protein